ncbi:MAG: response regulator transcription factor, partial [Pseudomonadota bacterium]
DPDIQVILKDNLEIDGYFVLVASSGRETLRLLEKSGRIELIILDLSLPDVDGIKVCETIRKFSDIPIIMLTARDGIADKVLGFERGADDYLVKPFDYLELSARIKACLRRHLSRKIPSGEIIYFADIEIDKEKRIVFKKAVNVNLTVKEFRLLLFFVGNIGKALTREEIREALWKTSDLYTGSRTIDVHVQHLRAKVEDNPSEPKLILTVQGIGYMLAAQIKRPSDMPDTPKGARPL